MIIAFIILGIWFTIGFITNCFIARLIGLPSGKEWGVYFICLIIWPLAAWEYLRPDKKRKSES